jgi:hypothetical protein
LIGDPGNTACHHQLPEREILNVKLTETPILDDAGDHVNQVVHPVVEMFLKIVRIKNLG